MIEKESVFESSQSQVMFWLGYNQHQDRNRYYNYYVMKTLLDMIKTEIL